MAVTHDARPGVGAPAGEHAAWWAHNAAALKWIEDHEFDPARAEAARADAVTAQRLAEAARADAVRSQRLAEAMAAAHTAHAGEPVPVPASTAGYEAGVDLSDVSDLDVLEVGL